MTKFLDIFYDVLTSISRSSSHMELKQLSGDLSREAKVPLKKLRIEGNIMIRVRRIDTPKARAAISVLEVAKE